MDRRQFIAVATAGTILPAAFADGAKVSRVGLIGCGWYGKVDLLPPLFKWHPSKSYRFAMWIRRRSPMPPRP